jgi:hypothetical protein
MLKPQILNLLLDDKIVAWMYHEEPSYGKLKKVKT